MKKNVTVEIFNTFTPVAPKNKKPSKFSFFLGGLL